MKQDEKICLSAEANKTILVVEQEIMLRFLVADALRDDGYGVVEVGSGDEALNILGSDTPIDLVFSDVRMEGVKDGAGRFAFARSTSSEVPVIMTSDQLPAFSNPACGTVKYLPKPYWVDQAIRLVQGAMA